jgi:hypothetical protein
LLADYGVADDTLTSTLGTDAVLDGAINYFLDIDEENNEQDDPWKMRTNNGLVFRRIA